MKIPMPRSIKIAALLFAMSCIAGLIHIAFIANWSRGLADPKSLALFLLFLLLSILLFFGPWVWVFYMIYRGYNWARIVNAIITVWGTVLYVKKPAATLESPAGYYYLAQAAVSVTILILIYIPSSNQWFRLCKTNRQSLKAQGPKRYFISNGRIHNS